MNKSINFGTHERHPLIFLKKSTLEGALIDNGSLKAYRNTLIIVINELEAIPEWFYHNNPYVEIIHILPPNKEERRQFALRFIVPTDKTSEIEILSEEFADLTEGFKTWDLDALLHTSRQQRIPLQVKKVWQLVDFYKFGQRHDPWEQLSADRVQQASSELSYSVIGQDRAIEEVTDMLSSARVGLSISTSSGRGGKPKGIFFFVGPTGVGKTELAKAMAKLVFGDEQAFARFDMSEYGQENADQKLIGAPPGFVGYEEGGQLTNRVLEKPYSILLFDEIEKAHPKILDKFLQILEDGRLTDSKGQTAYFNQTVIIFTSNIGSSDRRDIQTNEIRYGLMKQIQQGKVDDFSYEQIESHFKEEVRWYFTTQIGRNELLSRIGDNIIVFDLLRIKNVKRIGEKFLKKMSEQAEEKYKLNLKFSEIILDVISDEMAKPDNLVLGGRQIKNKLERLVERPLNRWIFQNYINLEDLAGQILAVNLKNNGDLEVRRKEIDPYNTINLLVNARNLRKTDNVFETARESILPELPMLTPSNVTIRLLNGLKAGHYYSLNSMRMVIGRSDPKQGKADIDLTECELSDSPTISRRHAVIQWVEGQLELVDLNSTNGSFVNGQRLLSTDPNKPSAHVSIHPGNIIKLGSLEFEIVC